MHNFVIPTSISEVDEGEAGFHLKDFLTELAEYRAAGEKIRIYETSSFSATFNRLYVFLTTSKEVQLSIGSLGWRAQESLAELLYREFVDAETEELKRSRLILTSSGENVLITFSREENVEGVAAGKLITYNISPVHYQK